MSTVKAADFKARCLALMDEVARSGQTVVITKRGKPVAELRPLAGRHAPPLIGLHKGSITISGDIMAPVAVRWNAGG